VIDLTTNTLLEEAEEISPSPDINIVGPAYLALTPDDTRLYVSNMDTGFRTGNNLFLGNGALSAPGNTVSVFDVDVTTDTFTPVGNVDVGNRPAGIEVTHDGTKVYVANYLGGTVSVINVETNSVIATVPIRTVNEQSVAVR
jgi:40-residue YVTN family beta-propeller repeat